MSDRPRPDHDPFTAANYLPRMPERVDGARWWVAAGTKDGTPRAVLRWKTPEMLRGWHEREWRMFDANPSIVDVHASVRAALGDVIWLARNSPGNAVPPGWQLYFNPHGSKVVIRNAARPDREWRERVVNFDTSPRWRRMARAPDPRFLSVGGVLRGEDSVRAAYYAPYLLPDAAASVDDLFTIRRPAATPYAPGTEVVIDPDSGWVQPGTHPPRTPRPDINTVERVVSSEPRPPEFVSETEPWPAWAYTIPVRWRAYRPYRPAVDGLGEKRYPHNALLPESPRPRMWAFVAGISRRERRFRFPARGPT